MHSQIGNRYSQATEVLSTYQNLNVDSKYTGTNSLQKYRIISLYLLWLMKPAPPHLCFSKSLRANITVKVLNNTIVLYDWSNLCLGIYAFSDRVLCGSTEQRNWNGFRLRMKTFFHHNYQNINCFYRELYIQWYGIYEVIIRLSFSVEIREIMCILINIWP